MEHLAFQRATADPTQAHPHLRFSLLSWALDADHDTALIFLQGAQELAARYEALGLRHLLPTDRVWMAIRSARPESFGGFHHPKQGYRHERMGALITRYGDLMAPRSHAPVLAALDLFRAYAHDCLHYGTFREYRLWDGKVVRNRYGINLRDRNGHTYSAPDAEGVTSTRNLGILMEGAADREATTLTRQLADSLGVAEPHIEVDRFTFLDVTGRLDGERLDELPSPSSTFLAAMTSYARGVNHPYQGFLDEIGQNESGTLHELIVQCMISGAPRPLMTWLDGHHRPFRSLFRAASYSGPEPDSEI